MTRAVTTAKTKDRLHSWKEIAHYLGRGVRTVQRWEREEGLPVHRQAHLKAPTILALTAELDAWLEQRTDLLEKPELPDEKTPDSQFRPWLAVAGVMLLGVAAAAAWWILRPGSPPPTALRPAPVTSYPGVESEPAFSPDGSRLAFTWTGEHAMGSIYVKVLGLDKQLRLTNGQGMNPAWSPDGRWIAFCRTLETAARRQVLLVSALGGPERVAGEMMRPQLFLPTPYLAFTPDGKWLVVADSSGNRGPYSALVLMSVESGEKRPLTTPPNWMSDTAPAFSPDGRTLAFLRADFAAGQIFLLRLTPEFKAIGEPRQLTHEKFPVGNPVWTADGREIIYGSLDADPPGLYRIPVTGRRAGQLIPGTGMAAQDLAFSRQGDRLAFSDRWRETDIWRLSLQEPSLDVETTPAAISSSWQDTHPQYSPDGTQIAFVSDRSGSMELWVCRTDGSGAIQLSSLKSRFAAKPSWSPDGKSIAFSSAVTGTRDIYVIPAAGGTPLRLTTEPGNDQSPVWSPDGRWLYFSSERGGEFQVWRMPAEGGTPMRITRNGGPLVQIAPDGKSVYYVGPWRRPSLWRASAEGGEEEEMVDSILNPLAFAVARDGVYYFRLDETAKRSLFLFRFATGKPERVALASGPEGGPTGMSVSPDGKFLLAGFWRVLREGDIMMMENFR